MNDEIRISVINQYGDVVSFDTVPIGDDTAIETVWQKAKFISAKSKVPLAVRWSRSTDGQVGYWGDNGASFQPVWA